MGMYDQVKCFADLPLLGANSWTYQSKDTPSQFLDDFKICEDGKLWMEEYDTEDRSDPNAEGILRLAGSMAKIHKGWKWLKNFSGQLSFYTSYGPPGQNGIGSGWVEFEAIFENGILTGDIQLQNHKLPSEWEVY